MEKALEEGFSVKVLLTEIIHLWVKRDVNSISRFFWEKKLMAVLLRFCRNNLGDKIFYCVINWTLWCRNSRLLLHRTFILDISERLKLVRMNNRFFIVEFQRKILSRECIQKNFCFYGWIVETFSFHWKKKLSFRKHL